MKRCKKCLLPENYPGITFNEEGICNYCESYKKKKYKGKEELDRFLEPFRNKHEKYDCVVGVSGGRDSSYMLYYLVKKCNLRVLAYTADHGFVTEVAKTNMKKMADILGVELVIEEHDFLKKTVKLNLSAWLRKPSPAMIPMLCCGCRLGINRGLLKCAKKNKVPLVVTGGSPIEPSYFKTALLTSNPLSRYISKIKSLSLLLGLLYEIIKNPRYFLNPYNAIVNLKEYFYFFHLERVRRLLYPNQTILNFYHYIEWDEATILSTIKNELNWRKEADSPTTWRADCSLNFLRNYLFRECIGVTEKDNILSNMIRENKLTREEAMERQRTENTIPQRFIMDAFNEIGLSPSDFFAALKRYKEKRKV